MTTLALSARNTEALKWGASVAQVAGYATMAMGMVPVNLALFTVGLIGWMLVGLIWQDRALVFVQTAALGALLLGMLAG